MKERIPHEDREIHIDSNLIRKSVRDGCKDRDSEDMCERNCILKEGFPIHGMEPLKFKVTMIPIIEEEGDSCK